MKIAVALSGGVDSSITLYLLKKAGHDVFGLFMKNWEEENADGHCLSEKDYEDTQKVCQLLDVPYYGVNFAKQYWEQVFTHFLKEIQQGYTPNPDILCNREIKFKVLFEKAKALGAEALATGHYCQTQEGQLFKGKDLEKDQSYFLYTIQQKVLQEVLFPIGHLNKSNVRQIAENAQLPIFNKKESMGICFIGKRNFREFIEKYIPHEKGPILTVDGTEIGTHDGIFYYTIGQRKGMGIGGAGEAWFVAKKDRERNALIVAQGEDHPSLFATGLIATECSWVTSPPSFPFKCRAKVRYRQIEQPCTVEKSGDNLIVRFEQPQRAITPRQSVVFYLEDLCLGGAIIEQALSDHDF